MEQSESHNQAKKTHRIILILIVVLAYVLRYIGHNWDSGFHFHPDERAIIMFADKIHFFDNLNPHFFSYGSLPIYILKGFTQFSDAFFNTNLATYDGMLPVGRLMSVIWDTGTIYMVFIIARRLFRKVQPALIATTMYATAFFPIQNSHFYIVDVPLNFFLSLMVYRLIIFIEKPRRRDAIWIGIIFGACLAIKVTPVIIGPFILAVFVYSFISKHRRTAILYSLQTVVIFGIVSLLTYGLCMPYTFLDFKAFVSDMTQQITMNSDPYIFPFTLQYVGTIPYLYYLKNIVLWGAGIPMILLSLFGLVRLCISGKRINKTHILLALFYAYYFLIIGRSAVKFMRYMLPLYPFIAICAGFGAYYLWQKKGLARWGGIFFLTASVIWNMSFMTIYVAPQTRFASSIWINQYIKPGSTLALEHWDDALPIYGGERYRFTEMTLYDRPDDEIKWQTLDQKLADTDYLIIASNRLYVPLQRLTDCNKYKACYPKTAVYYEQLFAGTLKGKGYEYKLEKEFAVYPTIPYSALLTGKPVEINDQSADESFTVYDHPRILIFRNVMK